MSAKKFFPAAAALIGSLAVAACGTEPDRWRPGPDLTWQVQLSGGLDARVVADVYDVDGVDTPDGELAAAADRGAHLVCYFSAGTVEEWRSDADRFPAAVVGTELPEWPGERWLDVRERDALLPIMADRMDACKERRFVAVDPDNVDAYANDSGFEIPRADQVRYLRGLSALAHERGLAFGLKNAVELVDELAGDVDFAVNEECFAYDECDAYRPLLRAGKPVVVLEYETDPEEVCADVPAGMYVLFKDLQLAAAAATCPSQP